MDGRSYPAFKTCYKDEEAIVDFCRYQLTLKHTRADYKELICVSFSSLLSLKINNTNFEKMVDFEDTKLLIIFDTSAFLN